MGFGAPAAIGAKLACPDKIVVALVGDGGFGQNPSVIAAAVEANVSVVWIVMNNFAYGTIAGLEMAHYPSTYAAAEAVGRKTACTRPPYRQRRPSGRSFALNERTTF